MQTLRVNIECKSIQKKWEDSEKRADHVIDRMELRGIGINQIKDAVAYGAKQIRNDGSMVATYRWYRVVYREFILPNFKKIYPITVLLEREKDRNPFASQKFAEANFS